MAVGYEPDRVLSLLDTIARATTTIAEATIGLFADRPPQADPDQLVALAERGRGLLAHGTGRLTIHTIGHRLGITDDSTVTDTFRQLLGTPPR